ncbi:MAG: alpha/beta hydrolase [Byssovorax sp.]
MSTGPGDRFLAGMEALARRRAARAFPAPGALIDIGGRRLQIDARGRGAPAVVLEAGLDLAGSLAWSRVHAALAETTRVIAYSRAGVMWSDPPDGPKRGAAIADDLHALLQAAGERPPFVLVGHSMGGPLVTIYTQRFPGEVAGLVLVDPSHPDQVRRLAAVGAPPRPPPSRRQKLAAALPWAGLSRWILPPSTLPDLLPADAIAAVRAHESTSFNAVLAESTAFEAILAEAGALRDFGARPLRVLSAERPAGRAVAEKQAMHAEQSRWSSRGEHRVVEGAGHVIQLDRPEAVIAAVRAVVEEVRRLRHRSTGR